jgi:type IV secretory pathway VirB4 component
MAEMQVNPLDPIFDDMSDQKSYLGSIIRLMLKQVDPERNLSIREAGLLDASLTSLYYGLTDPLNTPAYYVPRIEQLCQELRRQGAVQLAEDLELNYVSGTLGQVYNQTTNTDVGLERAVVTYDFKDIPEASRTLIYTLVLGRIQRIVRSSGRRRRIVAIDEFGWMAQEPILANVVAMWIKTFRTFGCGVWLAEQDLIRLTGKASSTDLSGHSIVGNSVFQLFFFHEASAAEVVAETFPNVEPYKNMLESFPRPQETGVAEAVLRIPDGAYHMYMILSDTERSLLGS